MTVGDTVSSLALRIRASMVMVTKRMSRDQQWNLRSDSRSQCGLERLFTRIYSGTW